MRNRILTLGILFLLVFSTIIPISFGYNVKISDIEEQSSVLSRGKTLYVGGSGPGNYSSIQDAIEDASNGDTVFVFDDSSPYNEFVWINKSINLIGEDRNTTVIDGWGTGYKVVVYITVDNVYVTGFTIYNCSENLERGIWIEEASNVIVRGNTISANAYIKTKFQHAFDWGNS